MIILELPWGIQVVGFRILGFRVWDRVEGYRRSLNNYHNSFRHQSYQRTKIHSYGIMCKYTVPPDRWLGLNLAYINPGCLLFLLLSI